MKFIYLISAIFLFTACSDDDSDFIVSGTGEVRYSVTLNASWSAETHPLNFPSNAHFSPLIGTTHNTQAVLWQAGDIASAAIEQMAETGKTELLQTEINTLINQGYAQFLISGDGIAHSPGSRNFTLPVNSSHSQLSLMTMIAPSPDWYIGVNGLELKPNGEWIEQLSVNLYAYDAGTDNGANYTSANADTSPQQPITEIDSAPFLVNQQIVPVATLEIQRL